MPTFRVTSPDGKTYEVNTPDGVKPSHDDLVNYVLSQHVQEDVKPDPYAKMSLDQIKAQYRGAQLTGGNPELLGKIADAYVSREQSERSKAGGMTGVMNAADNFVRDFASGTLGIGGGIDEASAYLNTLGGGNYQENLDYNRARDRFNSKQFGGLSTATQIGGGIASTIAGARALGVGAAPSATARFAPTIPQALKAGAVGAGLGATDGYLRGEGDTRANHAAIGGVLGVVLGTATPYVAGAVGAGTKKLMDFLTSSEALAKLGISRNAANVLIRQLSADDTLSSTGAQRIAAAGPDGMLADAGPSATNLLDTALQRSGPGSTQAREAIGQRLAKAEGQMNGTLDTTLGKPVGIETRQETIRNASAEARSKTYDAAYDTPINYAHQTGQKLIDLFARIPGDAWGYANKLMKLSGDKSKQMLFTIADDGSVSFKEMPDLRQLDYVKRALDAAAMSGEGTGQLGGQTAMGRAYKNLATELRNTLTENVPAYKTALETAADPASRAAATRLGKDALRDHITVDELTHELRGMTKPEVDALKGGIRDYIDNLQGKIKGMIDDATTNPETLTKTIRELSSKNTKDKLRLILGDREWRAFYGQLGMYEKAALLKQSVARGSQTFSRTSTDKQVSAQLDASVIDTAKQGRPWTAAQRLFQKLTGMTPEKRLEAEDRLYGEIAKALTTVKGKAAEKHLNNLRAAIAARSNNFAGAKAIGASAGRGAAGLGAGNLSALHRPSAD